MSIFAHRNLILGLSHSKLKSMQNGFEYCYRQYKAIIIKVQIFLMLSLGELGLMDIKLINIGFGNIVSANRVIAIVSPESAPIKRIINDARERGQLIDATYGRRTRAVIVTDSGHAILSAIQPETVANRFVSHKELQDSTNSKVS